MKACSFTGMCGKCCHRKACKAPCAFAEQILKEGNPALFERTNHRENITMLYRANKKELRETTLRDCGRDRTWQNRVDEIFSTANKQAFAIDRPKRKQTGVFIYRVLLNYSYEDIASIYGTSVDNVQKIFWKAKERILKALELCDTRKAKLERVELLLSQNEAATGRLPKYQKWFLMNKTLGMLPAEIANFESVKPQRVTAGIKLCADKLKTGEMVFLNPTDEEVEVSRQRLDRKRQRDKKPVA